MNEQHLRMSDAEREQAAAALGEHYAQGRLTTDEHGERLDQVWAARTRGELAPVFRDLPGPAPMGAGQPSAPAGRPQRTHGHPRGWHGLPVPLLAVLAVLVVLTVVTHLPLVLLGLLGWFFLVGRHRRRSAVRRW
ncbi:DUF1707 domain-containing protein [Nocardioides sp. KIGAM211]|uniref:DUF1707 domain-containing protein n=1 Tax=Nocardioides luti TaxID=2761101 RepID=A0A7X0RGZ3_9ACTN|nr:DUF1707 domain-containing protein [Nocardioides luti]MBB6628022.1 DUF1707 domain-containing protein [Nocardioides luti]